MSTALLCWARHVTFDCFFPFFQHFRMHTAPQNRRPVVEPSRRRVRSHTMHHTRRARHSEIYPVRSLPSRATQRPPHLLRRNISAPSHQEDWSWVNLTLSSVDSLLRGIAKPRRMKYLYSKVYPPLPPPLPFPKALDNQLKNYSSCKKNLKFPVTQTLKLYSGVATAGPARHMP